MTTPQDTQPPGGATLQEAYEATALRSKTSDPIGDYHKLLVASVSAVVPRRTREHAQSVLDEIWTLARALHAAYARGREDVARVEEPGKPDTLKQAKRRVFDTAGTYQVLDVTHDIMRERGMFKGDDGEARRVAAFRERVEAEDAMDEAIVAYAQALRDAAAIRAGGA